MATYDIWAPWLDKTFHLPGDVIILGVGDGRDCFVAGRNFKRWKTKKKLYACDCFIGLPYTDSEFGVDSDLQKGESFGIDGDAFATVIKKNGFDNIIPVIGLFEDALDAQLADKQFCFAWVDADLYYSTLVAIKFLMDRMVSGGIIGFHDCFDTRCPGVKKAINETLKSDPRFRLMGNSNYVFFERKEDK